MSKFKSEFRLFVLLDDEVIESRSLTHANIMYKKYRDTEHKVAVIYNNLVYNANYDIKGYN